MLQDGDLGIAKNVGITVMALVGFTVFLLIVANSIA